MNKRIEFLAIAKLEICTAADRYDAIQPGLGRSIVMELDNKLNSVVEHPNLYQLQSTDLYRFSLDRIPYQIYYSLKPAKIIVLGCVPARMEPTKKLVTMTQRLNQSNPAANDYR